MNKYLNDNWEEVIKALGPAMSNALDDGYKSYMNSVLAKIPAQDIDLK